METSALLAPVTALEFLQDAFLLTGRQQSVMQEGILLLMHSFSHHINQQGLCIDTCCKGSHMLLLFCDSLFYYFLAGEGPVLTLYSLQTHPKACASLSVLHHYRIHGIRPRCQAAVTPQGSATGGSREEKAG